jgi:hypothetical protein
MSAELDALNGEGIPAEAILEEVRKDYEESRGRGHSDAAHKGSAYLIAASLCILAGTKMIERKDYETSYATEGEEEDDTLPENTGLDSDSDTDQFGRFMSDQALQTPAIDDSGDGDSVDSVTLNCNKDDQSEEPSPEALTGSNTTGAQGQDESAEPKPEAISGPPDGAGEPKEEPAPETPSETPADADPSPHQVQPNGPGPQADQTFGTQLTPEEQATAANPPTVSAGDVPDKANKTLK